jgi:hypothetical protein
VSTTGLLHINVMEKNRYGAGLWEHQFKKKILCSVLAQCAADLNYGLF